MNEVDHAICWQSEMATSILACVVFFISGELFFVMDFRMFCVEDIVQSQCRMHSWTVKREPYSQCVTNFSDDEAKCEICAFLPPKYRMPPDWLSIQGDSKYLIHSFHANSSPLNPIQLHTSIEIWHCTKHSIVRRVKQAIILLFSPKKKHNNQF